MAACEGGENYGGNRMSQPLRPGFLDGFNQQEVEARVPDGPQVAYCHRAGARAHAEKRER